MKVKPTKVVSSLNRYIATVYHGGKLYGLGIYGTTNPNSDRAVTVHQGANLAKRCARICGGTPTVEVVTI